jgi:predicted O-methyltransferase YrrM
MPVRVDLHRLLYILRVTLCEPSRLWHADWWTITHLLDDIFFQRSDVHYLEILCGKQAGLYRKLEGELKSANRFRLELAETYRLVRCRKLSVLQYQPWNRLLYYLTRAKKPEVVVETGVFDGISSFFFLKALQDNGHGHLYSIDLPAYHAIENSTQAMSFDCLPVGHEPGWAVPNALRTRWTLLKGPSQELLQPLLNQVRSVDFFLHDSLHTYSHMSFEFETVWPHLKEGGILASDDADVNSAFADFAMRIGRNYVTKGRFAALVK